MNNKALMFKCEKECERGRVVQGPGVPSWLVMSPGRARVKVS